MSLNGVSSATSNPSTTKSNAVNQDTKNNQSQNAVSTDTKQESPAAVYEPSSSSNSNNSSKNSIYKPDTETINKLKADADKRTQQLRGLVEKLMLKQGEKITDSTDIYQLLREGKVDVDPETAAQAKADTAEDGYWGVEQTSDRIVSFAKALSGGDTSKADLLIDAVKKGFEEATKAWGDTLPDLCQKTYDSAIEKLNKWKESGSSSSTTTTQ